MATATATTTARVFTARLPQEEVDALSLKDLKAYQRFLTTDMDPVKNRLKELEEQKELDEKKELEEIEGEFKALFDTLVKVEVGDITEELSLHDALHGVDRTIMVQKRNGPEGEKEPRAHKARMDAATVKAFRKAIKRVKDIMQANPMRESKKTTETAVDGLTDDKSQQDGQQG